MKIITINVQHFPEVQSDLYKNIRITVQNINGPVTC